MTHRSILSPTESLTTHRHQHWTDLCRRSARCSLWPWTSLPTACLPHYFPTYSSRGSRPAMTCHQFALCARNLTMTRHQIRAEAAYHLSSCMIHLIGRLLDRCAPCMIPLIAAFSSFIMFVVGGILGGQSLVRPHRICCFHYHIQSLCQSYRHHLPYPWIALSHHPR